MISLTSRHHPFRVLAIPALLAAGCGGSPSNGNPSASQTEAQALKYAQCLNQHGVPAQVHGNGIESHPGPGGPAQQQQADQACQKYAPGGGGS